VLKESISEGAEKVIPFYRNKKSNYAKEGRVLVGPCVACSFIVNQWDNNLQWLILDVSPTS